MRDSRWFQIGSPGLPPALEITFRANLLILTSVVETNEKIHMVVASTIHRMWVLQIYSRTNK